MDIQKKMRLLGYLEKIFPVWSLKWKISTICRAYDTDLKKAGRGTEQFRDLEQQLNWETSEYKDKISALQSRKLTNEADSLYVYIPDLKWEQGNYGDRYLDTASMSKLYLSIREQKDKRREYYLKWAVAITGIIGSLIGLIAILKK
jgi:hypothetical protein